jgi:ankyrin repeat protein
MGVEAGLCAAGGGHWEVAMLLIDADQTVGVAQDEDGNTILHKARIMNAPYDIIIQILKTGGVNAIVNKSGRTPLTVIAYRNHQDRAIEAWIARASNVATRTSITSSTFVDIPMVMACRNHDIAYIHNFIAECHACGWAPFGRPLSIACKYKFLAGAQALLDAHANANGDNVSLYGNPLVLVCESDDFQYSLEMTKRLLAANADPNGDVYSRMRTTPLHAAFTSGNWSVATHLIAHGAKVDEWFGEHDSLRTALYWACDRNDVVAAEYLLAAGADANLVPNGEMPMLIRAYTRKFGSLVKLLCQNGADINIAGAGWEPHTLIYKAIQQQDTQMVEYLLHNGVTRASLVGDVFSLALEVGNVQIITALLNAGFTYTAAAPLFLINKTTELAETYAK